LWHFLVTPKVIPAFLFLTVLLLFSRYWLQALLILVGFALSAIFAMFVSNTNKGLECRWWKLPFASFRLAALIVMSMSTLNKAQSAQVFKGGSS
jgi:hypothetical protein